MTPRAKKALEGGIRKWERILIGVGEDRGHDNCPLCKEFYGDVDFVPDGKEQCHGRPVAAATKRKACCGTPYSAYRRALDNRKCLDYPRFLAPSVAEKHQALAMLRFLESLR